MRIDVFGKVSSQEACWDDFGSIWVPKRGRLGGLWGQDGVKKGKEKRCEKRPRLGLVLGGVGPIAVRSLGAGGDKGETWLPPGDS